MTDTLRAKLEKQAQAGDGTACYRLALLHATASNAESDWSRAREWLRLAADLHHELAARQYSLLGDSDRMDPTRWERPEPVPLCRAPVILALPGFFPPDLCDWLRNTNQTRVKAATVFDDDTGQGRADKARSNQVAALTPDAMDMVVALARREISIASGVPTIAFETSQVLRYAVGQRFDWHVDFLDPDIVGFQEDIHNRGQRIATCLIYLNDDFKGGETAFAADDLRYRGKKGDALMWSNVLPDGHVDRDTVHAGLPPDSGEKWVFSQWLRDRAPRS